MGRDLNPQPTVLETAALPIELPKEEPLIIPIMITRAYDQIIEAEARAVA